MTVETIGQRAIFFSAVLAAGVVAVGAGVLIGTDLVLGSLVLIGLGIGLTTFFRPLFGIIALIGSLVLGQLIRIPAFGAEGAVLPNDLLLPTVVGGWLMHGLLAGKVRLRSSPLSWPLATMLLVFLLTFIAGANQLPFLTRREQVVSSLYIIRWLEYAALFFVAADILRGEKISRRVLFLLLGAAVTLAVLGFIQLRLFPDFRFMVPQGWDPHIGRLLSTWFDPNFLGGFFSFAIVLAAGFALFSSGRQRIVLWLVVSVLFAALVLTFSRSSYAAFVASFGILTFLRSKRLLLLIVAVMIAVVAFVPRVQERVVGAVNFDQTARLRLVSWQNALSVARDYPMTGIGYNTYRYVQVTYGFVRDPAEHSAGGSDSSLLTIFVTTGPVGLATYLWLLWASFSIAWKAYRHGHSNLRRGLGLGVFAGFVSVAVHSFFINSLLFPHMLEVMFLMLGMLVALEHDEGILTET